MNVTNSPDFICKTFAKHYLTVLTIVNNTVNRSNKHNNNSNVLLVASALSVKSRIFYSGDGCNTNKLSFFNVNTKNMDLSNFIIGTHCHMAQNLILYLLATWPSPNLFFTRQEIDFCKDKTHTHIHTHIHTYTNTHTHTYTHTHTHTHTHWLWWLLKHSNIIFYSSSDKIPNNLTNYRIRKRTPSNLRLRSKGNKTIRSIACTTLL